MTMPSFGPEMMRNLIYKKTGLDNKNFMLSGGAGATPFMPSPMPNIPFMPQAQVGPQMIARGGNLGLPPFGSSYQNPMQIAQENPTTARPFNAGLFGLGANLMQRGGSSLAPMTGLLGQLMAARGRGK